jgi:hypothetical protein
MASLAPHPAAHHALTTRCREHRLLIEKIVAELWPHPDAADWIEIAVLVGSGGKPEFLSPSGGQGLLDIPSDVAVEHPFDAAENLRAGVTFLRTAHSKLDDVPNTLHRLLWSFAALHGGARGPRFANIALELSRRDIPEAEWWRWSHGKFWLMHRGCNVSYRYPDYRSIWTYVDSIARLGTRGARSFS